MGGSVQGRGSADQTVVEVGGRNVPVKVRRSPRARRVSLKLDARNGGVELVLPKRASLKSGLAFVHRQSDWITKRLSELPPIIEFGDGAVLPLRGLPRRIRHRPDRRGVVWLEDGEIHIAGVIDHLPRRLIDWLKAEARRDFAAAAAAHAAVLGVDVSAITIRDTRSRWGSCSTTGRLSFSWRLVMAPDWVLDYVAAHEVAHLREMSHAPAFWRLVARICPQHARAEAWLREHGGALQSIG